MANAKQVVVHLFQALTNVFGTRNDQEVDGGPGVLRSEQHPYGLPTLSEAEHELVVGDSVLLFRTLAMYILCEDVRLPDELQTALAIEQPEDPARYRSPAEVQEKKFMSIWRTREWQDFAKAYQVKMLNFDQVQWVTQNASPPPWQLWSGTFKC